MPFQIILGSPMVSRKRKRNRVKKKENDEEEHGSSAESDFPMQAKKKRGPHHREGG